MQTILRYRNRNITREDIIFISQLIADNPSASRHALSKKLCLAWNWVQPNGYLKDMVCRGLMLALHRQGYITLPPPRQTKLIPGANRKKPLKIQVDQSLILKTIKEIKPLKFLQVRRTEYDSMFSSLLSEHHYLGYTQPVGEHLKYIVFTDNRPIACLSWSSAPLHIGCRDKFIGWTKQIRQQNLCLIAYNSRFLILPWVKVLHLASHILAIMAKILPQDWNNLYGHKIYYLESFVDQSLFKGTSYQAANWIRLGKTSAKGQNSHRARANRTVKEVLGYPVTRDFRLRLCKVNS